MFIITEPYLLGTASGRVCLVKVVSEGWYTRRPLIDRDFANQRNGGRGGDVRPDCGAGGQARNCTSAAGACGTGRKSSSTTAQAVSNERGHDGGSH